MLIKSASSTELGSVANTLKGETLTHRTGSSWKPVTNLAGTALSPGWFPHLSSKGTN